MYTPFTDDEICEIANSLEDYHRVFYAFFEMANILYCEDVSMSTACVKFYRDRKPDLIVNREFWEKLNHRERLFVICHECLHVILMHDERCGKGVAGATPRLINIAQDITINEMIVFLFGFNRDDLRDWKKFCWIDTCFNYPQLVKKNETFTYYLELLITEKKSDLPELLDQHGGGGDNLNSPAAGQQQQTTDTDARKKMGEMAEKLAEELSPEELETLIDAFPETPTGGLMAGMFEVIIGEKTKKAKVKFQKLVKHLKRSRTKMITKDFESFVSEDRRFTDVIHQSGVTLPGKHETERPSKDRLLTVLFMDVSGSCIHFLPTFNKVYHAFSAEPDIFEVRSFAFDVKVVEINPNSPSVRMGGGTLFTILEKKVQELTIEYGKHPDCVIVITDGEPADHDGRQFHPIAPKKWVWLLTPSPSYTYLPSTSLKFLISDVVF